MIKGIKMAQIILAFRLDKEKLKTVRSTAQKTGFQVKEISRKDYKHWITSSGKKYSRRNVGRYNFWLNT